MQSRTHVSSGGQVAVVVGSCTISELVTELRDNVVNLKGRGRAKQRNVRRRRTAGIRSGSETLARVDGSFLRLKDSTRSAQLRRKRVARASQA